MARTRIPLIVALVSAVLLLLAFAGTTAVSFPLWFRYRNATGLGAARTVAQVAAGLAALGFFVTAAIVAIAAALQPASRWRKLLYVLPGYLLGFTLVGVLLYLLGIGTAGTFTGIWLAVGALLSMVTVIIAAARMPLGNQTAQRAIMSLSATGALSALAWLGMVVSLVIVLTSQPSTGPGGPNGSPREPGAQAAPTAAAPGAGRGQPEGQRGSDGPGGQFGPGGPQGSTTPLLIGVALMALFTAIEVGSIARARRAARTPGASPQAAAPVDYRREAGQAVFSCLAITIVALAAAQLVPIARDNPPAQTAVQWDSPQTENLARRACMDCHSNETRWPWYASVAPGSWLLRNHVSNARGQFNLSELNTVPEFRRARLLDDVAMQIRAGNMPPKDYLFMHPDARLTAAEKAQLTQGMRQSLTNSLPQ